jgi:hypothetical protein
MTREVVSMIVQVLGLLLAFKGYRAWRRQILGKTEHEMALAVLRSARLVQSEIRDIRHPGFAFVLSPSEDDDPEDPRHALQGHARKVYSERLSRLQEKVVDLRIAALDAESLWGSEASEQVEKLVACTRRFRLAIWEYFALHGPLRPAAHVSGEYEAETWAIVQAPVSVLGREKTDAFGDSLDDALSEIESFFQPKLLLTQTTLSRRAPSRPR